MSQFDLAWFSLRRLLLLLSHTTCASPPSRPHPRFFYSVACLCPFWSFHVACCGVRCICLKCSQLQAKAARRRADSDDDDDYFDRASAQRRLAREKPQPQQAESEGSLRAKLAATQVPPFLHSPLFALCALKLAACKAGRNAGASFPRPLLKERENRGHGLI